MRHRVAHLHIISIQKEWLLKLEWYAWNSPSPSSSKRTCMCWWGTQRFPFFFSIKALWGSAAGDLSGNSAQIFSDHSGPHHAAAADHILQQSEADGSIRKWWLWRHSVMMSSPRDSSFSPQTHVIKNHRAQSCGGCKKIQNDDSAAASPTQFWGSNERRAIVVFDSLSDSISW